MFRVRVGIGVESKGPNLDAEHGLLAVALVLGLVVGVHVVAVALEGGLDRVRVRLRVRVRVRLRVRLPYLVARVGGGVGLQVLRPTLGEDLALYVDLA